MFSNELVRSFLFNTVGSYGNAFSRLLVLVVFISQVPAATLGMAALPILLGSTISALVASQFENTIVRAKSNSDVLNSLASVCLLSGIFHFLIFFISSFVLQILQYEISTMFIFLSTLLGWLNILSSIFLGIFRWRLEHKSLNFTLIIKSTIFISVAYFFFFDDINIYVLVVPEIISVFGFILISSITLRPKLNFSNNFTALSKYFNFLYSGILVNFINFICNQGVTILIAMLWGPAEAGVYFVARRVVDFLCTLADQAFLGSLYSILRREKFIGERLYHSSIFAFTLLRSRIFVPVLIILPTIFILISDEFLNSSWDSSIYFFILLCLQNAFRMILLPANKLFLLLDRQIISFYYSVCRSILYFIIFFICYLQKFYLLNVVALLVFVEALIMVALNYNAVLLSKFNIYKVMLRHGNLAIDAAIFACYVYVIFVFSFLLIIQTYILLPLLLIVFIFFWLALVPKCYDTLKVFYSEGRL